EARRNPGAGGLARETAGAGRIQHHSCAAADLWLFDWRPRRNPGNAGFLRPARHHGRHRDHPDPEDQRSLRAHVAQRREIPLRDRYGVAEVRIWYPPSRQDRARRVGTRTRPIPTYSSETERWYRFVL